MKTSSGILLYRKRKELEVFLVHPGGPFWKNKDIGAWSIPKGEFITGEDPLTVAKREFKEETGSDVVGEFQELTPIKQKGGKTVYAWCIEGNINETGITSNKTSIEWPPRSGRIMEIPEVDKGGWFTVDVAMVKINKAQVPLLTQLLASLEHPSS